MSVRQPPHWTALGEHLRAARDAVGLLQVEVALHLGVNPSSISSYEHGITRPRPERLAVYAALVRTDLDELLVLAGYAPAAAASID